MTLIRMTIPATVEIDNEQVGQIVRVVQVGLDEVVLELDVDPMYVGRVRSEWQARFRESEDEFVYARSLETDECLGVYRRGKWYGSLAEALDDEG